MSKDDIKVIARNRKALHDYHIVKTFEAGIVLQGSEIKSIRHNNINLRDGFVQEREGELWLIGVHISPYEQANRFGHADPMRPRKLLLHKREIAQIVSQIRERGFTVIPTMVCLRRGLAKIEIAIAKGKKQFDKRDSIRQRESNREIQRTMKENLR
jgi:SsrA-binding protein